MAQRQQEAGRDLGVERLGRRHAHLDVATVGRVEHAVGLVGEVAVATVDDGDDPAAARPHQVDGAVGVGGGARLADGDDERVGHVGPQVEAGQLGGQHGPHLDRRVADGRPQGDGQALAGDGGGALADHQHPADRAGAQVGPEVVGQRVGRQLHRRAAPSTSTQLAAQRLAERRRRLGDLLEQEVRGVAPVDVAGGDLGGGQLVGAHRQRGAVVGEPLDARRAGRPSAPTRWTIWPRVALGLVGSAGVSPSMRR